MAKKKPSLKYDATDSTQVRKRRQPMVERKTEDNIQSRRERLTGSALGRDMQRNQAGFSTIVRQFQIGAVGTGPKLILNTDDDDFNKQATGWFNSDWSKWCDGTDDNSFADLVSLALGAEKREGDCLFVFDDFLRDDGRIIVRESDQIVPVRQTDWERASKDPIGVFPWKERDPNDGRKFKPMIQENGFVRDSLGRVMAYIFTNEHGLTDAEMSQVTIVPRWDARFNPEGSAKLFKRPWRFNQLRGVGDALTVANLQTDVYEMIAAELQSAKVAAQNAAFVEVDADQEGGIRRAMEEAGATEEQIDAALYGDGSGTGILSNQYNELEGLTGGRVTYGNPGEQITYHSNERPAESVSAFAEVMQTLSGAAMGLGRSRSTLKAESSYTAFRGEELMSWAAFEVDQKNLERRLVDWLAFKAITWGVEKGEIKRPLPAMWNTGIAWSWPKMREVDEVKTANAERMRLKNGSLNYRDLLGANWDEKLEDFGIQLDMIKQLGLPLSIFETVSGAIIEEIGEDFGEEEEAADE